MERLRYAFYFLLLLFFSISISHCRNPDDCVISEWSTWSECSNKCSRGIKTQTRTIVKPARDIFAEPCPRERRREAQCGSNNNDCDTFCDKKTGICGCHEGFRLSLNNSKICVDVNECDINFGRGPCSQMCINTHGSYNCLCYQGFYLQPDGHDCHFNSSSQSLCYQNTHRHHNKQGECVCKNKLEGKNCNRNPAYCSLTLPPCARRNEMCLTFIHATKRCVSKSHVLPILFGIPVENFNTYFHYEIEEYISNVLEGKENRNFNEVFSSRKRRATTTLGYYVEATQPLAIKSFTYVQYAVLDVEKGFLPIDATALCSKFQGNEIHCLTNQECNLLKSVGMDCPFIYDPQPEKYMTESEKPVRLWIIIVAICVSVIVVFILIVFVLRKRGHFVKKRSSSSNRSNHLDNGNESPLIAVAYSCPPPPYSVGNDLPNVETFDIPIFDSCPTGSHQSNDNKHLYESVDNLKHKIDEVYEPMDSGKKKQLMVDLPPYEARYTTHSDVTLGNTSAQTSGTHSEEVHYAVPTNNKLAIPESHSDDE